MYDVDVALRNVIHAVDNENIFKLWRHKLNKQETSGMIHLCVTANAKQMPTKRNVEGTWY